MSRLTNLVRVVVLGSALFSIKIVSTILTVLSSSAIAAVFVMLALSFASSQSDGAIPALGYLASLGVSFILIFTSYVGARGAAQSSR